MRGHDERWSIPPLAVRAWAVDHTADALTHRSRPPGGPRRRAAVLLRRAWAWARPVAHRRASRFGDADAERIVPTVVAGRDQVALGATRGQSDDPHPHGRSHLSGDRYHPEQRRFQDRFDTRRLADRLDAFTTATLTERHRVFVEARDMFFIATADRDSRPQVSYKGGEPGFVRVIDDSTLVFPVYNGNGMFLTAGNLAANPHVGLLFIDLEGGSRLRMTGEASIDDDDPLVATYPGAELVVRITVREVFPNCRRYVHHYQLVERSPFVPSGTAEPPVPDWKLDESFDGALPADDPAHDPTRTTAPAIPEF